VPFTCDVCGRRGVLHLHQLIEEHDIVVAIGQGEMTLKDGGPIPFVFDEAFTFVDDKVSQVETFHINLNATAPFETTDT
jgi:hypothetical protein